ncbi:MAG: tripartite tricarboxylate transporter substrate binding protein [Betaproteobacteria bacterium]|nr:tripartite tricarboxylate transporter substrate binding protein [Betaproteobacteria bacterium]
MGTILRLAVALAVYALSAPVPAQQYPAKPIRVIVPFAPGGATDSLARILALNLSHNLGQRVIVDNRPGAGGTIGTEIGVTSSPDGYTFVVVSAGYCVNPSFYKLKFDPVEHITPVARIAKGPLLLTAHPSVPVRRLRDLIDLAKAKPEQMTYATSGRGSMGHMTGELIQYMTGIKLVMVPYRGTGAAIVDTVGGQTFLNLSGITSTLSVVKSGKLRAIAVTSAQRISEAPGIPTVAESGLPGFEVTSWQGLIGPKGLARAVVDRINREVASVIRQENVLERFRASGIVPEGGAPEKFAAEIRREISLWRKIAVKAGIHVR